MRDRAPCPASGGPAWTQWESAHFVVLTDLAAADAVEVVRGFEDMRQAVLLAAWRRAPEPRGRLGVVVFRDDGELRAFLPSRMIGAFITVGGGPIRQSFIVKGGAERDDVVTHELVHALALSYGLLNKVEWLDEGLARYLEGMRLQKDGTMSYGEVHTNLFRSVTLGRLTSFENLWHAPRPEEQAAFSATSWITVHYLFNHEATRFAEFQRQLIDGATPLVAWRSAFPDLDARALDARLAQYVFREGQFTSFVARLPPTPHDATVEGPKKLIARHPDDAIAWALLMLALLARQEPQEAAEALEELTRVQGGPGPAINLDLRLARPD